MPTHTTSRPASAAFQSSQLVRSMRPRPQSRSDQPEPPRLRPLGMHGVSVYQRYRRERAVLVSWPQSGSHARRMVRGRILRSSTRSGSSTENHRSRPTARNLQPRPADRETQSRLLSSQNSTRRSGSRLGDFRASRHGARSDHCGAHGRADRARPPKSRAFGAHVRCAGSCSRRPSTARRCCGRYRRRTVREVAFARTISPVGKSGPPEIAHSGRAV